MFGRGKKHSPLDKRLKEVRREIAKLNRDMRSAARTAFARAAVRAEFEREKKPATEAPAEQKPGSIFPEFGAGSAAAKEPDLFSQNFGDAASSAGDARIRPGKERFASYFMAGHFTEMRPLRRERRVMRNRAILLAIIAILALIVFFYTRFGLR